MMRGGKGLLMLAIAETTLFLVLFGALLLGAAGTLRVPMLWVYLLVNAVLYYSSVGLVYVRSPDLLQERMRPGAGEQDKVSIAALIVMLLLHYAIAGMDVGRYHWSGHFPVWLQIVGLIVFAAGFLLALWAMLVNRFFSSAVRMQEDRGQTLVTTGPYAFVRHPGYTGGLLFLLSSGVALGSWWSIVPVALGVPLLVRRTLIEERMLQGGLAGYTEYAQRVRYRLIPGVW